jgi:hypothetical protein
MKRFVVHKQETTSSNELYTETETETPYSDSYLTETETEQVGGKKQYTSIAQSNFRKPNGGTKQDNMTKDEIKSKLVGYVTLRTKEEKKLLTRLPLWKTWVRYINESTKQFRSGGLLMKVQYPDYIMLANPNKNLVWSVQLNENVIFVKNPKEVEQPKQADKEGDIKNKLYEMYKRGMLTQTTRK